MLDVTNSGYVFVDDIGNPTCGWMFNSEGFFLAGNSSNHGFKSWLKEWSERYIHEESEKGELTACLYFDIDSEEWKFHFPEIIPLRPPLQDNRIHYLCTEVKIDWREMLPTGYTVHRIDRALLENKNISCPHHLYPHWITSNWGSLENFSKHGFGTCIIHRNRIVSYSLCDCCHGDECEIGIQTLPEYRKRGFATVTAAANAEYALSHGYSTVGWHTHDYNLGSQRTAERVGFEREREYEQYACMVNAAMHVAEGGVRQFLQGTHDAAIKSFETSFAMGEVDPWFYFMCARSNAILGELDRAMELLLLAVDNGWTNAAETRVCLDFIQLHSRPEWNDLLTRMRLYRDRNT